MLFLDLLSSFSRYFLQKLYSHKLFYFLLFDISFCIRRYYFSQENFIPLYLKKKFLSQIFLSQRIHSTPHPFNSQNPLSVTSFLLMLSQANSAIWLNVCLQTKLLQVQVSLQSHNDQTYFVSQDTYLLSIIIF